MPDVYASIDTADEGSVAFEGRDLIVQSTAARAPRPVKPLPPPPAQ